MKPEKDLFDDEADNKMIREEDKLEDIERTSKSKHRKYPSNYTKPKKRRKHGR